MERFATELGLLSEGRHLHATSLTVIRLSQLGPSRHTIQPLLRQNRTTVKTMTSHHETMTGPTEPDLDHILRPSSRNVKPRAQATHTVATNCLSGSQEWYVSEFSDQCNGSDHVPVGEGHAKEVLAPRSPRA